MKTAGRGLKRTFGHNLNHSSLCVARSILAASRPEGKTPNTVKKRFVPHNQMNGLEGQMKTTVSAPRLLPGPTHIIMKTRSFRDSARRWGNVHFQIRRSCTTIFFRSTACFSCCSPSPPCSAGNAAKPRTAPSSKAGLSPTEPTNPSQAPASICCVTADKFSAPPVLHLLIRSSPTTTALFLPSSPRVSCAEVYISPLSRKVIISNVTLIS